MVLYLALHVAVRRQQDNYGKEAREDIEGNPSGCIMKNTREGGRESKKFHKKLRLKPRCANIYTIRVFLKKIR